MLFQVIHCHPLTESYNHALFRVILDALAEGGHEVVASDLYREALRSPDERRGATQLLRDRL